LFNKWYKLGQWLLWISNRKSSVADRSLLIRVTFLQRISVIVLVPFDLEWQNLVQYMWEERVCGVILRGRTQHPLYFWNLLHVHTCQKHQPIFCMVIKLDERIISTGFAMAKYFCDKNADAWSVCGSSPSCSIGCYCHIQYWSQRIALLVNVELRNVTEGLRERTEYVPQLWNRENHS